MDEEVVIKNERVDDIPLLLAQMERMGIVVDGRVVTWRERRLVIRFLQHAKRAEAGLQRRIENAKKALSALNGHKQGKIHFREVEPLREAAEVKKHGVDGLLRLEYDEIIDERPSTALRG